MAESLGEKSRPLLWLLGAAVALVLAQPALNQSERLALEHELTSRSPGDDTPPEYALVSALLGGLRGIFLSSLWIHAGELRESGRHYEMVDVYKLITRLQPGHTAAWAYLAWDLAYNLSLEDSVDAEEKVYWVFRAIDSLRAEGIPKNPKSPELFQELAWIFHHKIGAEQDAAFANYRRHLALDVTRAFGTGFLEPKVLELISKLRAKYPEDPRDDPAMAAAIKALSGLDGELAKGLIAELEGDPRETQGSDGLLRFLSRPAEGARALLSEHGKALGDLVLWCIGRRIEARLGMKPALMADLSQWHSLGPIDWRRPEAHALYWGRLAKSVRQSRYPRASTMRDQYIVNHALMKLVATGEAVMISRAGNDTLFFVPNYHYLRPTMAAMDEALAEFEAISQERRAEGEAPIMVDGMRDGYENFLINMVLNAWLDRQPEYAGVALRRLKSLTANERYDIGLDDFAARELKLRLQTMTSLELCGLVQSFYARACERLADGEMKLYQRRMEWVRLLHERAQDRARETLEGAVGAAVTDVVPDLMELQRRALLLILQDKLPGFKEPGDLRKRRLLGALREFEPRLFDSVKKAFDGLQQGPAVPGGGSGQ